MEDLNVPSPGSPPPRVAKYRWLASVLTDAIPSQYKPGDQIPSERELAEQFGVSRMTARHAITYLAETGQIDRVAGLGSFVSSPALEMPLQLSSFTKDMEQRAMSAGARTLSQGVVSADDEIAARLDVPWGSPVTHFERLRSANGVPIAIENVHLPADLASGLVEIDVSERSLYEILRSQFGIVFSAGRQVISARTASAEDAELLGIRAGAPVLHNVRTSHWQGRTAEYTRSVYRGDRYQFVMDF
ncbi:GntR family transcriptional regulator [Demequina sediminicola]|uniref:GntR family transcriptional regulator n=1 Tax=Demequina sediminicola TaxID=1095026 RepID=UPI00078526DF|nr:GntR family transcriptional regulator [Demequina sediminicola]